MKSLGIDIGSSSVKVSLLDIASGECAASSANPATEMPIGSPQSGWAEQDPEMWWHYVCEGIRTIAAQGFAMSDVVSVGRQSSFRNRMYRHHSCTALVTGDLLRTYPSLVSE